MPNAKSPIACIDAHNDCVILRQVREDPMDLAVADPLYHVDLPRLRAGNVVGLFVMVGDNNLQQSVRLIDAVHAMGQNHPDDFALCVSRRDIERARQVGQIALVMSIEGQAMFGEYVGLVRQWYRLGVRVAAISHGEGKFGGPPSALQYDRASGGYLSKSARSKLRHQEKGLTPFARESLKEMARLGMVLDLTHASDASFWDAIELYEGAIYCTHSNCFALCPHARNLTNDMMRALAQRGGVMGLCPYQPFVDQTNPSVARLVDHAEHALDLIGEDHLMIGTDFDGIPPGTSMVIEAISQMGQLWNEMSKRGISTAVQQKIGTGNLLSLLPA